MRTLTAVVAMLMALPLIACVIPAVAEDEHSRLDFSEGDLAEPPG